MSTISIFGCGWLGLPLAKHLISQQHRVIGSTTTTAKLEQLQRAGIEAHQLKLTPNSGDQIKPLLNADIAIVTLPPSYIEGESQYYLRLLQNLTAAIAASPIKQVIFTATTSIYPQNNTEVRETDAVRIESPFSDTPWMDLEQAFTAHGQFETTIVRFAGLIGGSYQPGHYFSGRELKGADDPVNMIHRDDCIGIISAIIEQNAWGQAFNASAPIHPTRRELYSKSCQMAGIDSPKFSTEPKPYRIVNCDKLVTTLGYRFVRPDPVQALGID
ncbi:NAD-dependent epimerase/dehydratase family protein [Ferrimonas lipolytica]|uniref:NAD-dependent epimerase/dehydratase family protein n=1 Tax=Ferrimonas lipolytica TaxID=2724191 RepID=A0A6H1UEJ2_9GAMM|nr:NAD-dependent epimerase/dehydratase family protein [Ferrimonas lipolytica]QIZ76212.1 NAD-dependent epimerase/dehydratase family protein [Ferrimonas lipolytica]